MVFSPPSSLTASLRNGVIVSADRVEQVAHAAAWDRAQGTYRFANRSDFQKINVYAFTLTSRDGLLITQGDDAREYLVRPTSERTAEIVCHEASPFFGKILEMKNERELLLGGVPFQVIRWSAR